MKVKDLLERIKRCSLEYGPDFLDWDVYTEQLNGRDKFEKTEGEQKNWGKTTDEDGWDYFQCHGFWTIMEKERIFTINVNF